jgi:hypothetical protein
MPCSVLALLHACDAVASRAWNGRDPRSLVAVAAIVEQAILGILTLLYQCRSIWR